LQSSGDAMITSSVTLDPQRGRRSQLSGAKMKPNDLIKDKY